MSDMNIEKTAGGAPGENPENITEEISEDTVKEAGKETPDKTSTELVEERIESEGELTAASAEKEYAQLEAADKSGKTSGEGTGEEAESGGEENGGETGEEEPHIPRARGLYRYIKISLPTLNKLIVVLCVALVLCLLYGVQNRGYIVDFDSRGGTPVESEKLMYSDKVIPPEEPYREGYTFTGWYTNADCTEEWDLDTGLVGGPMTLYAGWEKKDQ